MSSSDITKIITVQIDRQTTGVSRVGFGTLLFISEIPLSVFTERVRSYSNLSAVEVDFASTTNEYKAAAKYFGQSLLPESLLIGRKLPSAEHGGTPEPFSEAVAAITEENDDFYAVAINSRIVADILDIAVWVEANSRIGLYSKNDDVNEIIVIEDGGTYTAGSIVANVVVDDAAPVVVTTPFNTDKNTTLADFAVDIAAVAGVDSASYTPGTNTLLVEAASNDLGGTNFDITGITGTMTISSVEANDILSTATNDVGSKLQDLNYTRNITLYNGASDGSSTDLWPEVAWAGEVLPTDPGSVTWKFKTLAGVTADRFTDTERGNVLAKNVNIYETIGGVSITQEGVVAIGEFIDNIRGVDWLEVRLQEDIYAYLVNQPKVPYTDNGIVAIESLVKARLQNAIDVGLLSNDPAPTTDVPLAADVLTADKISRTLNNVTFEGTLAGAIHFVNVTGVVTV
jgi:hypothetical protein